MFASRPKASAQPSSATTNVVALPPRNAENVLRRLEWTVLRRLDGLLHNVYAFPAARVYRTGSPA